MAGLHGLFIDGEARESKSNRTFVVIDPANEEIVGEVADASAEDGTMALEAAIRAQKSWALTPSRERSAVLYRAYALMIERLDEMSVLIVRENGKSLTDAKSEVLYAAEFFRWFSEEAVRIYGQITVAPNGLSKIMVQHQPVGVCLLVTPWNFPAAMITRKLGPALAAGCAVVCKPAEDTPLTALYLAGLLHDAGVPSGVVNVLPTTQPDAFVSSLLDDPRIRMLSFTGSTEVGRSLLARAAKNVVKCSMELGGNAPFIVFADADLTAAVDGAVFSKMRNDGQACTASNRFYVERSVAEEFGRLLASRMEVLTLGHGLDASTDVGPLINVHGRQKVSRLVDQASLSGAQILLGGSSVDGKGFFYAPTVMTNVDPSDEILSSEIFGPVAPIVSFSDEAAAISYANDTEFGLVSYLYTSDLARGLRIAESLEAGMVAINRGSVSDPAAPFGGIKHSGLGREGGSAGIFEYLETKYISCDW